LKKSEIKKSQGRLRCLSCEMEFMKVLITIVVLFCSVFSTLGQETHLFIDIEGIHALQLPFFTKKSVKNEYRHCAVYKVDILNRSDSTLIYKFQFDDRNNIVGGQIYREDGFIRNKLEYENGRIVKIISLKLDTSREVSSCIKFTYKHSGTKETIVQRFDKGQHLLTIVRERDSLNRVVSEKFKGMCKHKYALSYKRKKDKLVVTKDDQSKGGLWHFTYNNEGQLVEYRGSHYYKNAVSGRNEMPSYRFIYDKQGVLYKMTRGVGEYTLDYH
jgi:hypothetical protein